MSHKQILLLLTAMLMLSACHQKYILLKRK